MSGFESDNRNAAAQAANAARAAGAAGRSQDASYTQAVNAAQAAADAYWSSAFAQSAAEDAASAADASGADAPDSRDTSSAPASPADSSGDASDTDTSEATLTAVRDAKDAKKNHTATYIIAACIAALLILTMLGGLLNVGDHLMGANVVLGWIFYGLIAVLIVMGIVWPIVRIAQHPVFSLYQLRDERGNARKQHCRMLVDNLIANTDLTDDEVAELQGYLLPGENTDDLLIAFFHERCVPAIDTEIKRSATTAFFASAIARSPLISTVTMLAVCLDLVRSIVERCGFRPTNFGLARLYSRVMLSALIVGGIEDSDLSDLLGTLLGGGVGGRTGGIVLSSATDGIVSAFLVFRVGVITKRWLLSEDGPARMAAIRKTSYREALGLMRSSGFLTMVANTVKRGATTVATSVASSVTGAAKAAAASAGRTARSAAQSTMDAVRSVFGGSGE